MRAALLIIVGLILALLTWANWPSDRLDISARADRIVIEKCSRRLTLLRSGMPLKQYRVALGQNPVGPKEREGDSKTPEGVYHVVEHNQHSSFHLALRVSYPGQSDIARAASQGVAPGSDIMIHGIRNGLGVIGRMHCWMDWTAGCIAVTDTEIEEIARTVSDGAIVEIRQ